MKAEARHLWGMKRGRTGGLRPTDPALRTPPIVRDERYGSREAIELQTASFVSFITHGLSRPTPPPSPAPPERSPATPIHLQDGRAPVRRPPRPAPPQPVPRRPGRGPCGSRRGTTRGSRRTTADPRSEPPPARRARARKPAGGPCRRRCSLPGRARLSGFRADGDSERRPAHSRCPGALPLQRRGPQPPRCAARRPGPTGRVRVRVAHRRGWSRAGWSRATAGARARERESDRGRVRGGCERRQLACQCS